MSLLIIAFISLTILAHSGVAADSGPTVGSSLSQARSSLAKWVETKQLITKTQGDWQVDRETLEQTSQLLQRELKSVEEQMSKLSTNSTQVETERLQADALLKASNQSLDQAKEFCVGFEGRLAKVVPQLPVPLRDILKPLLGRLPSEAAHTRMAVTERVQVVVGILNELDKFNNAVSIFSEKRKSETGVEVAVETVYVGLGAAYFVNEAGDFAGMGAPGRDGWEWAAKPELAASIREVIEIYRNERPARFVALPANIR